MKTIADGIYDAEALKALRHPVAWQPWVSEEERKAWSDHVYHVTSRGLCMMDATDIVAVEVKDGEIVAHLTEVPEPEVKVLDWQEEWSSEDEDGNASYPEYNAYGSVAVEVDGQWITVGVRVGVPEWKVGTAIAARSTRGMITAWFEDASDTDAIPRAAREAVEDALIEAAPRLWAEAQAARPEPEEDEEESEEEEEEG